MGVNLAWGDGETDREGRRLLDRWRQVRGRCQTGGPGGGWRYGKHSCMHVCMARLCDTKPIWCYQPAPPDRRRSSYEPPHPPAPYHHTSTAIERSHVSGHRYYCSSAPGAPPLLIPTSPAATRGEEKTARRPAEPSSQDI